MRIAIAALLALTLPAAAQSLRPDQAAFRDTYRELVETNTTLSSGDCTLAANRMAARLKAAGYPDSNLHVVVTDGHPREGSLVAVLPGANPHIKAILLLAHLDVVEARREDWSRDPFALVEEDGLFLWPRHRRRQIAGRGLGGHHGPPEAGGPHPHRQVGADLR